MVDISDWCVRGGTKMNQKQLTNQGTPGQYIRIQGIWEGMMVIRLLVIGLAVSTQNCPAASTVEAGSFLGTCRFLEDHLWQESTSSRKQCERGRSNKKLTSFGLKSLGHIRILSKDCHDGQPGRQLLLVELHLQDPCRCSALYQGQNVSNVRRVRRWQEQEMAMQWIRDKSYYNDTTSPFLGPQRLEFLGKILEDLVNPREAK